MREGEEFDELATICEMLSSVPGKPANTATNYKMQVSLIPSDPKGFQPTDYTSFAFYHKT